MIVLINSTNGAYETDLQSTLTRLTINTNQTYYILFTTKRIINLPNIHINNELITKTNKIRFPGVLYDSSTTQASHK